MRKYIKQLVKMTIIANIISVFAVSAATDESFFTYYIQFGENAVITGYNPAGGNDVVIPNTLGGYPVGDIDENAFRNRSSLTSVTISDSVYTIGGWVFSGCTSLSTITFGSRVVFISEGAFADCKSLNSIKIPDNVTRISDFSFVGCANLSDVTIPDTVTRIGINAFSGCEKLTSITIPGKVTQIGDSAFRVCKSLTEVTFKSENPPILGLDVFEFCDKLTTIYVPSGSKAAYQAVEQLSMYHIVEKENSSLHIDFVEIEGNYLLEIKNLTNKVIFTKGLYLTDDEDDLFQWQMPSIVIRAGQSIRIVVTDDSSLEPFFKRARSNFDMNAADNLFLTNAAGEVMEQIQHYKINGSI